MEAITVDRSQTVSVSDTSDVSSKDERRKGTVTLRNYVMNDLGALRKKLKHEGRKHDFMISNEAKDCSNTVIQMKTSFFEFTKAKFIEEILQNDDIESVQNAEAAKAATETSGEAYVEFSMDITFKAKEKTHTVKVIAYTTTCQLMIQPKGEQSGVKAHLGSRGTPRYFADTFLIPWCQKSVDSNAFNEKMSGFYLNALNNEIKRMEASKTVLRNEVKKRAKNSVSGDSTNAKCVNKGCSFKGLDPNNKSAVGICANCSNFEHFACIRIKQEHKDDILKGNMKFYCSECFSKNPSIGSSKVRPRLDSLPLLGQGYLFKVTKTVTAIPASTSLEQTPNMNLAITQVIKCDICSFETDNQDDLTAHNLHVHTYKCDHCAFQAKTQAELEDHVLQQHTIPCNICDTRTLRTRDELVIHMDACHSFPCTNENCNETFTTTTMLTSHMKSNHSISCTNCNNIFDNQRELEEHTTMNHKFPCDICEETFSDNKELREHHESCHVVHCNHCEAILTSEAQKEKHVKDHHNFYCVICDSVFVTASEMAVHNELHASNNSHESNNVKKLADKSCDTQLAPLKLFLCYHCDKEFENKYDLINHMNKEHDCPLETHYLTCQKCCQRFKDKNELEDHHDISHPSTCKMCGKEEMSKEDLNNHIMNTHAYKCNICDLTITGEVCMEDHILDKHAVPDADNTFKCDDCTFETKDKNTFGKHYKDNHGHEASKLKQSRSAHNDENKKLVLELKEIKNNFERLESLYHESLEEVNQVKAEYEAKIIHLNENYEGAKIENEALKEKVDILFKLGRSYIDNATKNSNKSDNKKAEPESSRDITNLDDDNEVIEVIENNTSRDETLRYWTKMKMRGFKRVSPTTPSISNHTLSPRQNVESLQKQKQPSPSVPQQEPPRPPPSPGPRPTTDSSTSFVKGKYCHYFVNTGNCSFEEKTGKKCKFEHKKAPMCLFGINCARPKCQFSHPNFNGNVNFLGNTRSPNNLMPWQMVNPWITSPQYHPQSNFQNYPWNTRK